MLGEIHSKGKRKSMFERLGKTLAILRGAPDRWTPLTQWAASHGLTFRPLLGSAYAIAGDWQGRGVRVECGAPSRTYVHGMELMGRIDLGLTTPHSVIVMNRALKRALEQQATALYASYTDPLQTSAALLPEEIRWLAVYRDAGWAGPEEAFWERYAVLTDSPETARAWIDESAVRRLMDWPGEAVSAATPVLYMLRRGKSYLRLQIDQPRETATAAHALQTLLHLSEKAIGLPPV